jgi:hypothetical protein
MKNNGSSLPINNSLNDSTFSGNSQVNSKLNLGFLGIYGFSSISILSSDFSLDFAHHALDHARNLLMRVSCL